MSEPAQGTFYGVKSATMDELVTLVRSGNDLALGELKSRLPSQLFALVQLYQAAYGADRGNQALMQDLHRQDVAGKSQGPSVGVSPTDRHGHTIQVGTEVVILAAYHGRQGQLGRYVGLADTVAVQKYRILIRGDVVLAKQGEFDVI